MIYFKVVFILIKNRKKHKKSLRANTDNLELLLIMQSVFDIYIASIFRESFVILDRRFYFLIVALENKTIK